MATETISEHHTPDTQELQSVTVRFAGDSGDGIQLTGSRFTSESEIAGHDVATLPNFPAEIRAPAGSLAGVSGFQIHFGSSEIFTPGDQPDVLVAFNPAALKTNLSELKKGGILIVNEDAFTDKNLHKAGYKDNPCDDPAVAVDYRLIVIPITKLTREALSESGLSAGQVERCKNFFALGVMLWMFQKTPEATRSWISKKFASKQEIIDANIKALDAGMTYAEATELLDVTYKIKPADLKPGVYTNLNGTSAMAYGLVAASKKSGLQLFLGAYPITPATEVLQELAKLKYMGVVAWQAEDEIAAICATIGAAYAGALAVTSTSGPGMALKLEALGLAVMAELPMVVINSMRAGPSTGMPTRTEQSDLMQACFGRHGEAPLCVMAATSPVTAFSSAYEACRIALKYMTPVVLLSDSYINTSAEPWRIPDPKSMPAFENRITTNNNNPDGPFMSFLRDEKTLSRPWALPGTEGLEHRIGGLEKEDLTGNVSYSGENHHQMCLLRAEKISRIVDEIPPTKIDGPKSGKLLLVGWGSTEGALTEARNVLKEEGVEVSRIHLTYLNPLPPDLGDILSNFEKVLVPEINLGQLRFILRANYLVDAIGLNKVTGNPFFVSEIVEEVKSILGSK